MTLNLYSADGPVARLQFDETDLRERQRHIDLALAWGRFMRGDDYYTFSPLAPGDYA